MIRISVNQLTTFRWKADEDIRRYAAAGVQGVGLWRPKLSDIGEDATRAMIVEHGLEISHLGWAGGFTGDGWTFDEAVDDAIDAIELARQMGARQLLVHSGARQGHTRNYARKLFIEALTTLAPVAETYGVRLLVEPQHPKCGGHMTWLASVEDYLDLAAEVRSSCLGLVLDTYHVGHHAEKLIDRLPELLPHIGLVQIADRIEAPSMEQNRLLPGEGSLPIREFLDALVDVQYDGFVDLELYGEALDGVSYDERLALAEELTEWRRGDAPVL